MGLLDKLKPQAPIVRPTDLALGDDGSLRVKWDDGKDSNFELL